MHLSLYDPYEAMDFMEEQILRYARAARKIRHRVPYISALLIDGNDITARVIDGHTGDDSQSSRNDALVTAHYPGGGFGLAIALTPSPRQIHEAIARAEAGAFQGVLERLGVKYMHPEKSRLFHHYKMDLLSLEGVTRRDLSTRLAECEAILARTTGIIGTQASLFIEAGREVFCDSLGRKTIQDYSRLRIHLIATARASDMPEGKFRLREVVACSGTLNEIDWLFSKANESAASLANRTVLFAQAEDHYGRFKLSSRIIDVVLEGALGGVSIHEVGTGHLAEVDWFIKKPCAGNPFYLGKRVGIPSLNIVDNPLMKFGNVVPGSYYHVDHEGVIGGKTYLVKDGKFHNFLTSRESAGSLPPSLIRKLLTGNARLGKISAEGEDGERVPYAPESRMSTLMILPVKSGPSLEGLLRRVAGKGLYMTLGQATGESYNESAQGMIAVNEIYFVDENLGLHPIRPQGQQAYIVDNGVAWMGKIKAIGNPGTVTFESSICESDSGDVLQCTGGAAVLVKGANLLLTKYRDRSKGPLIPVPSRKKM